MAKKIIKIIKMITIAKTIAFEIQLLATPIL